MSVATENFYWRHITKQDKVIDCGDHWEAESWLGRNMGVVYWEGQEDAEAQKFLASRAVRTKKDVDPQL